MRIETELKLDYSDVLIRPKRSTLTSRSGVDLTRQFEFRNSLSRNIFNGIPIMTANMDGVGTFEMAKVLSKLGLFTCLVKTYTADQIITFFKENPAISNYVAMSIGITDDDIIKLNTVKFSLANTLKYICVDVANGYTETFSDKIAQIRDNHPSLIIIAGNVVTGEMTEELILRGADIAKVGVGPGSVCRTRTQTGVGYPQLSAVIECADAAHGLGGHIIADGGCSTPGDVAKAFAAGADFVMLGGMFAGHDEGGGEIVLKWYETGEHILTDGKLTPFLEQKEFIKFYGMSSKAANDKHFGGLKNYRASEGIEVLVPYKGSVTDTVQEILGGLRSTCTYVGASKLKYLTKCATLIRCTDTHNRIFEKSTIGK